MIKIAPSILAADFTILGKEITDMVDAGADIIHMDVMDGHFVNNISFGAPIIADARKVTDAFFDTHLMIEQPLRYIEHFAKAGSDRISFHVESKSDTDRTIDKILSYDIQAGLTISPYTPVESVLPYLDKISQVMIMSVEPGHGGQPFMEHVRPKIRQIADWKRERNLDLDVQVDGGINLETAPLVAVSGANVLVAGSALFSQPDYKVAVKELREVAEKAYRP